MTDRGEVLDIKIADIKATAPRFHHQSVALAHALTKLTHGLETAGSPWGGDEQGERFHKAYGPHVQRIERATRILTDGLASVHEAMADMVDGHIDNEELIRAMFSRVHVGHGAQGEGE
ncbi:WXG100 family type VII secretion target [Streptomyces murinus]